jgi:hypothetical protein
MVDHQIPEDYINAILAPSLVANGLYDENPKSMPEGRVDAATNCYHLACFWVGHQCFQGATCQQRLSVRLRTAHQCSPRSYLSAASIIQIIHFKALYRPIHNINARKLLRQRE